MDEQDKIDLEKIDKNKDGKVYQCPMCAIRLPMNRKMFQVRNEF